MQPDHQGSRAVTSRSCYGYIDAFKDIHLCYELRVVGVCKTPLLSSVKFGIDRCRSRDERDVDNYSSLF